MKSYLIRVRDKKIRNGYITLETIGNHWKQGLLCDKKVSSMPTLDRYVFVVSHLVGDNVDISFRQDPGS